MYMQRLQTPDQADVPSKNLWVGNLPEGIDTSVLWQVFSGHGRAVDEVILYKTRRYAYVLFKRVEDAAAAKKALQDFVIWDIQIKIEFDHEVTSLRALVGFKFMPSDRELVTYFLSRKVRGLSIPSPLVNLVPDCDLYGESEPWQIWEKHGGNRLEKSEDLYFFTELKRKTKDGVRINRRIGSGTWKGEDGGKALHFRTDSGKEVSGLVKRFRYEDGVREMEGRWIMHEYSIEIDNRRNEMKDYVLCRIRRNENREKRELEKMMQRHLRGENCLEVEGRLFVEEEITVEEGMTKQPKQEAVDEDQLFGSAKSWNLNDISPAVSRCSLGPGWSVMSTSSLGGSGIIWFSFGRGPIWTWGGNGDTECVGALVLIPVRGANDWSHKKR